LIKTLQNKANLINPVPQVFVFDRDPKDEPYINLAAAAGADYLVSRDRDMLDLMTGYGIDSKAFRQRFRPLKVVDPEGFLRILGKL
jgi:predicted nucleic acid-binding protein